MNNITAVNGLAAEIPVTAKTPETTGTNMDFSEILSKTLEEQIAKTAITGAGAQQGAYAAGYPMMSGGGIEQAIMAAASSGDMTDAQIAIFMLCTMMQSGGGSDFSPLMGLMSAMLTQLNGDTGTMRENVMQSQYSPYVLDLIDKNVFNTKLPTLSDTGAAVLPREVWRPTIPAVVNAPGDRSPEKLREVIDQFRVETAERYEPFRNGYTYCNIFVWDVTSALGCEIPHYVDPVTGTPREYPDTQGARELGAIGIEEWLAGPGQQYGWRETNAETAQQYANEGKAAVTTAGQIGHVQVVCPSENGEYDSIRGVAVAQAGRVVTNYTHLSSIYSASGKQNVRYFVHD